MRQRDTFNLLAHSSNACNSRGIARLESQEPGTQSWSPVWVAGAQVL